MKRARVGSVELEFEIVGTEQSVLLIHGGNVAREFEAMSRLSILCNRFQLIRYHRRGMAGSSPIASPTTIAEQASDAIGVLDFLGVPDAHVVGHSLGGSIALEVAARAPWRVRSLALLEPILTDVASAPAFLADLAPAHKAYEEGKLEEAAYAVNEFIAGPNWREFVVDPTVFVDAVRDARTFFEFERPALASWSFDGARARMVNCPVLSIVGTCSGIFFREGRALLHSWFPSCVDADVVGATHFLESQDPTGVAEPLAAFLTQVDDAIEEEIHSEVVGIHGDS